MYDVKQQYDYILNNLPIIEVCLFINEISIKDFIMYLQYGIPFEQASDIFSKLSKSPEFISKLYRGSPKENLHTMKYLISNVSNYITLINRDGNNAKEIYKDTIDICKEMCDRVDNKLGDSERYSHN